VNKYHIPYHERAHGQLFCDDSAELIIAMLRDECRSANVLVHTNRRVKSIRKTNKFSIVTDQLSLEASSLVIATGGLSIPKLGATSYGFTLAEQFGLNIISPQPGLVPMTFHEKDFKTFQELSGISMDAEVGCNGISFRENILFTHRGLSGPAVLQISSYWNDGYPISINLLPDTDILKVLEREHRSKKHLSSVLEQFLPARFVKVWLDPVGGPKPMNQYSSAALKQIALALTRWRIVPTGTEGYQKAEVTVGGIDTNELSSKTMESKKIPGLFFIGEVVDVTGWLGGYNFQWAWSSGWAAGQVV
jgi:hypothetical protein